MVGFFGNGFLGGFEGLEFGEEFIGFGELKKSAKLASEIWRIFINSAGFGEF